MCPQHWLAYCLASAAVIYCGHLHASHSSQDGYRWDEGACRLHVYRGVFEDWVGLADGVPASSPFTLAQLIDQRRPCCPRALYASLVHRCGQERITHFAADDADWAAAARTTQP